MNPHANKNYLDTNRAELHRYIPATAEILLDVGCNNGIFGSSLKEKQKIIVWGVEPNKLAADTAATRLDRVFCNFFNSDLDFDNQLFDVISFNDVLEHMPRPQEALTFALTKLKSDGIVIASVPNILHIENLIHMLIDKDFKYEEYGIRDDTHLRFYTYKSIHRLFSECGYNVVTLQGINEDWWRPTFLRRVFYRLFSKQLAETKHIQIAIVATPATII